MSRPAIDRLRAALDRFNRTGELDTSFLPADFEVHQASSIIDTAGVFRGRDALQRTLGELGESFGDLSFEAEDICAAPGGEIVMLIHARARGHRSGMEIDNRIAWVWTVRGDELTRLTVFEEQEEALAAVGLLPHEGAGKTPRQNVDLVRSIFAAWEAGDFAQATDWAHPEIDYVYVDGPAPSSWKGRAGMAQGFREGFLSAWENLRLGADEYRTLDGERVLVLIWRSGQGKASGLDLAQLRSEGALLFHIRDARVTRIAVYWERERALADLGLTA